MGAGSHWCCATPPWMLRALWCWCRMPSSCLRHSARGRVKRRRALCRGSRSTLNWSQRLGGFAPSVRRPVPRCRARRAHRPGLVGACWPGCPARLAGRAALMDAAWQIAPHGGGRGARSAAQIGPTRTAAKSGRCDGCTCIGATKPAVARLALEWAGRLGLRHRRVAWRLRCCQTPPAWSCWKVSRPSRWPRPWRSALVTSAHVLPLLSAVADACTCGAPAVRQRPGRRGRASRRLRAAAPGAAATARWRWPRPTAC
jgi:hypothetical protein